MLIEPKCRSHGEDPPKHKIRPPKSLTRSQLLSALYIMLPSSKQSLIDGGSGPKAASWILIACFLGGVFGIQVFSRVAHHFMPSQAVDCDHTHDDSDGECAQHDHKCSSKILYGHDQATADGVVGENEALRNGGQNTSEVTPLLSNAATAADPQNHGERPLTISTRTQNAQGPSPQPRMPGSLAHLVSTSKRFCDADGSCFGYTDPCGIDCFKNLDARGGTRRQVHMSRRPALRTSATVATPAFASTDSNNVTETARHKPDEHEHNARKLEPQVDHRHTNNHGEANSAHVEAVPDHNHSNAEDPETGHSVSGHHHHVPKNAFLSLSLQTSIAIALHKLPEGFITYATNHANPSLGFTVFLAIAVHNTSEGFALALPIFLASGSRIKALLLTLLLGGLSQPIGAGIAAAWLKIAERDRGSGAKRGISDSAYGGMFAVTAGIMASVALSLIQESFELSHNRKLCLAFIFIGMGILGMSSALTA